MQNSIFNFFLIFQTKFRDSRLRKKSLNASSHASPIKLFFHKNRVNCIHKAYSPHIIKFNILRLLLTFNYAWNTLESIPSLTHMHDEFARTFYNAWKGISPHNHIEVFSFCYAHIIARKENFCRNFLRL